MQYTFYFVELYHLHVAICISTDDNIYLLHFIIIRISNGVSLRRHLSELKNFSAILNNRSTGAEVAGTHKYVFGKACQIWLFIIAFREFKIVSSRHPKAFYSNFVLQLRTNNQMTLINSYRRAW